MADLAKKLKEGVTVLPEIRLPILEVSMPEIRIPGFPPPSPKLKQRQVDTLRYTLMDDIGALIPWAGDILSDITVPEIRRLMSSKEYKQFMSDNKLLPSTIAAIKVFIEQKTRKT